jgi:hypothetical protein
MFGVTLITIGYIDQSNYEEIPIICINDTIISKYNGHQFDTANNTFSVNSSTYYRIQLNEEYRICSKGLDVISIVKAGEKG